MTLKSLKPGWQIVKFGEIAKEVKSTTKDPAEDGLEFYVGLDHLDPQSLRLARRGIIAEDNPSFTRRFSAGQILFGKRRCYQKKAAVADFDGICSGDIIVMDSIPKKIIPGLLPFIIQSDAFFDWAEKTSSGSLSPRTKWKSLAEFEFPLPPIERQKEILKVLEKLEECQDKCQEINIFTDLAKNCLVNDIVLRGKEKKDWNYLPLINITDKKAEYRFTGGPFGSNLKREHYTEFGVRVIQLQNIGEGEFFNDYKIYTSEEKANELKSCNIFPGELLLSKMGDPVARALIVPDHEDRYLMCSDGIRLVIDSKKCDILYIMEYLNGNEFRQNAISKSTGTTRRRISLGVLKNIEVLIPPLGEQKKIASVLVAINSCKSLIKEKIVKITSLKKKVLSDCLFGGLK